VLTATITTASWSTVSAPYTTSITVTGILATDTPIIDVVMTGTFADDEDIIENWGGVYRAETTADVVTFSATELPTVDLPIQLKVVR
jgi:ABC-type Fe2+-enterobactin transport system substrate-binding protein